MRAKHVSEKPQQDVLSTINDVCNSLKKSTIVYWELENVNDWKEWARSMKTCINNNIEILKKIK
jgi:hypothetical protein